jgi:hypothetical protein
MNFKSKFMKKIISSILIVLIFGIGLIAFAETTNAKKTVDLTCMQSAVEKRDGAIITAWDKYTASVKSALETRKSALKSAWTITEKTERISAIKTAWNNYKSSIKTTRQTWMKERKATWQTWKTDAKACAGNAEDKTTESVDNTL